MSFQPQSQSSASSSQEIDQILADASEKMKEVIENNREQMENLVKAQRQVQAEYNKLKAESDGYEKQATELLELGDREGAKGFMGQKAALAEGLESLGKTLEAANQSVEFGKKAIQNQEDEIRRMATQALGLKMQLSATEIQEKLNEVLSGMDFNTQFASFSAGRDLVQGLEAEVAARQEVFGERHDVAMMKIDEAIVEGSVEDELRKLEAKIGSGEVSPVTDLSVENFSSASSSGLPSDDDFLRGIDATLAELDADIASSN